MKISIWNVLGAQDYSRQAKNKLGIVAVLYLIQGAPAAILWEVLPVYFRLHGVSLRAIGGLRLLELPYSLKVFWSPLVHRYGDRRMWILGCMLGIATILFALPFVNVAGVGWIVLLLILSLTTLSATQDVAIDSYSDMIRYFGDKDPTTRRLMEEILAKEEEHADDMSTLLAHVGKEK